MGEVISFIRTLLVLRPGQLGALCKSAPLDWRGIMKTVIVRTRIVSVIINM